MGSGSKGKLLVAVATVIAMALLLSPWFLLALTMPAVALIFPQMMMRRLRQGRCPWCGLNYGGETPLQCPRCKAPLPDTAGGDENVDNGDAPASEMSRRIRRICWAFLIGVVGFLVFIVCEYAFVTVPNAYALWNSAELTIRYMEANEDAWPRNWEDLRDTNDRCQSLNDEGFADLMERVEIDWTVDPAKLAMIPEWTDPMNPPFQAIRARNGRRAHWSGREPNRMIWDYLTNRAAPAH